jgi:molybdate transport system permease protein
VLFSGMANGSAVDALRVTLITSAVANALILLVGTPAAYLIGVSRFCGRDLVITLVELPLVLPPAVAESVCSLPSDASACSAARSRRSASTRLHAAGGDPRRHVRRRPLLPARRDRGLRSGRPEPSSCGADARRRPRNAPSSASRSRWRPAGWVRAPRWRSRAGSASSAPRSCSPARLRGVTQTLSLAIYEQFDIDFDTALAIGAELVLASGALLMLVKLVIRWRRSDSTYAIASATSSSS